MNVRFLASALALFSVAASAQNYPNRSDNLWVTTPDHNDWLYKTGENATVDVQLYHYGVPADAMVTYEVSPDMLQPARRDSVRLKNGKASIKVGTRKTPGFQDLRLSASFDGVKTTHHIKVGYSADKIEPVTKMPDDFRSFWDKTIEEARKTPVSFSKELAPEYCTDRIDCWLVKLRIDKEHSMYGYLTMPKDAQPGKHPVVLYPPGAGVKTIKDPLAHKYYAENGFIRLEMEIHGLDPRLSADLWKDINAAFNSKEYAYLNNNLEKRDSYYMRHVYAGMVRCIDFLTSLPEFDGRNVAVQGGSQGGALALVTAALDSRVTLCVANHPALTDMAGYSVEGRTGGYPHFKKDQLTAAAVKSLAYYDIINFCRIISCPVRLTWGYNDSTCPPTTSYAAYNVISAPKEAFVTPINEHWTSVTMEKQHMEWILKKLK